MFNLARQPALASLALGYLQGVDQYQLANGSRELKGCFDIACDATNGGAASIIPFACPAEAEGWAFCPAHPRAASVAPTATLIVNGDAAAGAACSASDAVPSNALEDARRENGTDGRLLLAGFKSGWSGNVILRNGFRVRTLVAKSASCSLLKRVIIEGMASLVAVEDGLFANSSNLEAVALINCPSLQTLGNHFCESCPSLTDVTLAECLALERIGSEFCALSGVVTVDLSACRSLRLIDYLFCMSCDELQSVRLSGLPKLRTIANGFCFCAGSDCDVEISNCRALSTVGDSFCFRGNITTVTLRALSALIRVGKFFAVECDRLQRVTIADCPALEHVSENFLCRSSVASLDLGLRFSPSALSDNFLRDCTQLPAIDMAPFAHTTTAIGNAFGMSAGFTQLDLRPCGALRNIGTSLGSWSEHLVCVDLSGLASLEVIDSFFCRECPALQTVSLASCTSLVSIGNYFLANSGGCTVDMRGCSALLSIGDFALYKSQAPVIDLSGLTSLERVGEYLAASCSNLRSLDLSGCVALKMLGSGCCDRASDSVDIFARGCPPTATASLTASNVRVIH